METVEKAVASLEREEVEEENNWEFSDRESLNSVCHLGCTFPSSVVKSSHMKNDITTSLSTGFLEVGVDANLFGVGGQLEDLVKAAQTYGQLRFFTKLLLVATQYLT